VRGLETAVVHAEPRRAVRGRYHHGDLRNALAAEALRLARVGGPEAVVLREVTRRVGVSATAAYRHFADRRSLLTEVKDRALAELAKAVVAAVEGCDERAEPGEFAEARLRAVAHAYLGFAFAEPGLFGTVFHTNPPTGPADHIDPDFSRTGAYCALGPVLDGLVESGRMPRERRPHAEFSAWTAIHGIAVMFLDGALRFLPRVEREAAIAQAVENGIRGLTSQP
jgi:AcrR family transcriptional regulator